MIDHRGFANVLLGADIGLELSLAGIYNQLIPIKNMMGS